MSERSEKWLETTTPVVLRCTPDVTSDGDVVVSAHYQKFRRPDSWTDQEIERLKYDWNVRRLSSNTCAALYGRTRSAVLGQVDRLRKAGVYMRSAKDDPRPKRRRDNRTPSRPQDAVQAKVPCDIGNAGLRAHGLHCSPKEHQPQLPSPERVSPERVSPEPALPEPALPEQVLLLDAELLDVKPPPGAKTMATLEMQDCRWPIGDPGRPNFHFCGARKMAGLPYCEHHARIAYRPPEPRRLGLSGKVERRPFVASTSEVRAIEKKDSVHV